MIDLETTTLFELLDEHREHTLLTKWTTPKMWLSIVCRNCGDLPIITLYPEGEIEIGL